MTYFTKAIFKELAEDGKQEYHRKLAAYYKNRNGTQSKMVAALTPKLKTPEGISKVPCSVPSNIKESLQGLDMDLMTPIPIVPLPFGNSGQVASAPRSISPSTPQFPNRLKNIGADVLFPAAMGTMPFPSNPEEPQVRPLNGSNCLRDANSFTESSHQFSCSSYYPSAPESTASSFQYQNNGMGTHNVPEGKDDSDADEFKEMISKILKY